EESSSGYVSYANKLVRVGSGAASIRPQYRPRAPAPPLKLKPLGRPRQVVIDGEIYKGNGNKLVRISSTSALSASAKPGSPVPPKQRIVDIDGEKYVRTKRGSLIRIGAVQALNHRRQRLPVRKRLCTKFLFGKCEQTADTYWVEKGKCLKKKCRLPHPAKRSSQQLPTKEEEEHFLKQYIQRPVFDKADKDELGTGLDDVGDDSDGASSTGEALEDLSEDEAEELLKWYDDNYIEAETAKN
ncbi:hypothetical protein IWW36_005694, partial [Coemansia brasiliensis]